MDLVQVGKFISELRKEKGMTQEELGQKVGVTNKTVSRWETGTYLPSADVLLILSEIFHITINELLSGKRLTESEYIDAAEKNLTQAIKQSSFTLKERIEFFKKKWLKEHIASMCCWGVVILSVAGVGLYFQDPILFYVALRVVVIGHCWRNNTMMAYVELNAFDRDGSNFVDIVSTKCEK